ncbi:unannotated protein [freshwater metagenome]|uniref:diacylglycerol O-acyltransferase n=1 Tax=freshwater metagenome TaxID=449393 RepID=A0A6J7KCY9_9ZZZZ|nr:DUF1298 domain-containing protein [Actinomycetota bacterium]
MSNERFDLHMSDSDALMWNIEKDPLLRSTIVTVLLLDRAPDWDALVKRVDAGTKTIARMRQRVATPMLRVGPPMWTADTHFDLAFHMTRLRSSDGTIDSVLDIARNSAMAGFDRARPLWQYTVVEGLDDDRAAMVLKVHHSLTDGIGGMKLLMMLFDLERDGQPLSGQEPDAELTSFGALDLITESIKHRRRRAVGIARRSFGSAGSISRSVLSKPKDTAVDAGRAIGSIARFLEPATNPKSPIMGSRTLARSLGTLEVPMDDLKRAAKATGASLNDAYVAAVLGGLMKYHHFHGESPESLRMVMPISIRDESAGLGGNHFTPARFLVPMTIEDPTQRIAEVGRLSRWIRDEPAIALTDALAGVLNQLPTTLSTAIFGAMLKGADFVTSNVPGAPIPLYAAGAELQRMYAFGPLSGAAANLTLLSHCGTACIGVNVDAVAVPDIETFLKAQRESFAEVLALGETPLT